MNGSKSDLLAIFKLTVDYLQSNNASSWRMVVSHHALHLHPWVLKIE